MGVGEHPRQIADLTVELKHFLDDFGDSQQSLADLAHMGLRDSSAQLAGAEGKQGQYCDLACECLCRGDADFGADVDVGSAVGFAWNRADNVADAVDESAFAAGELYGG